ncbi:MinD/ParA family ATP-binding protein [Corynebacterium sp. AOP40-9SA-29]|uniref:MinD/ParA family ATP-binding protein n=1 Tax=Corynebacterium sp. AOP40-9SA-29 TaxID=3457677 RepID=UPI00403423FA
MTVPAAPTAPTQFSSLDASAMVGAVSAAPPSGWRRLVHRVSGGRVNPGESTGQTEQREVQERISTPLRGDYRIAVLSLKGGVGKTTTTVALGGVFASLRGDRVIAVDANPDLGTLARRVVEDTVEAPTPTVRDLLDLPDASRYPQVRSCTSQASSRLEVIGSDRDPAVSEAFSESDYRRAVDVLQHHYNIILTDCGTGLMHSAMSGVLDLAHMLVLVTSPALDGAKSAEATLDWLDHHGHGDLVANAVVVVSGAHPGQAAVDPEVLSAHFSARTRAVRGVPFDRHLSEGGVVDLDRLAPATFRAYRELAATVAEDFGAWHRHAAL